MDKPTPQEEDKKLLIEATKIVVQKGKVSPSMLQRKLQIGYARASRYVDTLQILGIISRPDGENPRGILVKDVDEAIKIAEAYEVKNPKDLEEKKSGEGEGAKRDNITNTSGYVGPADRKGRKIAVPVPYSEEIAAEICGLLATGMSTRQVVAQEGMPARETIFFWLREHEDFRKLYYEAKEFGVEAITDEMTDIADDGTNDYMTITRGDQEYEVLNREHVERSKLRISTRQWIASKLKSKKYGDRLDLVSDGEKLEVPIFGGMSRAENRKDNKDWQKPVRKTKAS